MKFIPAILTTSTDDLKKQLDRLLPYFQHFSLDIEDGKFSNSTTYQIEELLDAVKKWDIQPFKNCVFDFDLMIENWEKEILKLQELSKHISIKNIFPHARTLKDYSIFSTSTLPFSIGLAFDVKDTIEDIAHKVDLNSISALQIMTIESGPQSQAIIPRMLNKIGALRHYNYRYNIYIDGGVNEQSLQVITVQKSLPDFACVGSYLSHADSDLERRVGYLRAIEKLTTKAKGA